MPACLLCSKKACSCPSHIYRAPNLTCTARIAVSGLGQIKNACSSFHYLTEKIATDEKKSMKKIIIRSSSYQQVPTLQSTKFNFSHKSLWVRKLEPLIIQPFQNVREERFHYITITQISFNCIDRRISFLLKVLVDFL